MDKTGHDVPLSTHLQLSETVPWTSAAAVRLSSEQEEEVEITQQQHVVVDKEDKDKKIKGNKDKESWKPEDHTKEACIRGPSKTSIAHATKPKENVGWRANHNKQGIQRRCCKTQGRKDTIQQQTEDTEGLPEFFETTRQRTTRRTKAGSWRANPKWCPGQRNPTKCILTYIMNTMMTKHHWRRIQEQLTTFGKLISQWRDLFCARYAQWWRGPICQIVELSNISSKAKNLLLIIKRSKLHTHRAIGHTQGEESYPTSVHMQIYRDAHNALIRWMEQPYKQYKLGIHCTLKGLRRRHCLEKLHISTLDSIHW